MTRSRRLLADEYPEIAAQWHPTKNAGATDGTKANNPLTAETAGISMPIKVWWQCAHGHEWFEAVNVRRGGQRWKRRVDDCPDCETGPIKFACGHSQLVLGVSWYPSSGVSEHPCWECARTGAHAKAKFHDEWAIREAAHRAAAGAWLDANLSAGPPGLPAAIYSAWRHWAEGWLARAYAHDNATGNSKSSSVEDGLRRWSINAQRCEAAQNTCTAVRPFPVSKHHVDGSPVWPSPSLYGGRGEPVREPWRSWAERSLSSIVEVCRAKLASAGKLSTDETTRLITATVEDCLNNVATPSGRLARRKVHRELGIGYVPAGATRLGRTDVALMWKGCPDVLIEIDHMDNPGSTEKLDFVARDGGIGLWIRWDCWEQSRIFLA